MREKYLFDLLESSVRTTFHPVPRQKEKDFLSLLADQVSLCGKCPLRQGASVAVFGEGDPQADLMFVGEGPGEQEDRLGRPFVGPAGQLLDKILAAAEIKRQEVYIANVVKCRPPGNRLPLQNEVAACLPYLKQQIRLIQPKILVCLGSPATQAFLGADAKVSRMRGMWYEWEGIKIMPTYHPAALLRDMSKKRPVWEDIQKVRDAYRILKEGYPCRES